MSIKTASLTPLGPSILADSPRTMINKLLGDTATSSPSLLSPSKRVPSKKMLERATPIRQARYLPVIEELNRVFEHNRPVPGSTNVKVSAMEHPPESPSDTPAPSTSPRAYHLTPHQVPPTPELQEGRGQNGSSTKLLALQTHPINSLRASPSPEPAFDSIMRLEIKTYENAAKVHALAQSCLRLASLSIDDKLTESENYIFNAQSLLYKCLNYFIGKKLDTKEELWLQVMCKVDMGRTAGEVDFTIYWFKKALKNLDRYLEQSATREEIERCQEVYESISNICLEESENSTTLKELTQNSVNKIAECKRRLESLNPGAEHKPIPSAIPLTKAQPNSWIKNRRIFVCAMTFIIAGLAIAQRTRIINTLGNTLRQFSQVARITSLFNRMTSSLQK